jgi:hypothetical protein
MFGYTSTLPSFSKPCSSFHATAQGIWLLSLLLEQNHTGTAAQPGI